MKRAARREQLVRRAAVAACVAIALAHGLSMRSFGPCDDEYIVFRYARNLAEGQGLVFNEGERFEGFSVPLWTLLHTLVSLLRGPHRLWSQGISILALGACAWSSATLWRRWVPGSRWPVPALFVAASPALALHAAYGLGTTLLAALLVAALACFEAERRGDRIPWRTPACLGLAILLRQEALLFALPFLLAERRRRPWIPLAITLAPVLLWMGVRLAYFERWLPITHTIKKLGLGQDLLLGGRYLATATLESGFGAFLVLALLGALAWRRMGATDVVAGTDGARPREQAPVGFGIALAGVLLHTAFVVAVGGDFMPMARFFVPTLPVVLLLACFATRRWLATGGRRGAWITAGVLLLLQVPQGRRPAWRDARAFYEERWECVGRELGRRWPADTTVALAPIGIIGFHSRLPIVDLLGLTHDGVPRRAGRSLDPPEGTPALRRRLGPRPPPRGRDPG